MLFCKLDHIINVNDIYLGDVRRCSLQKEWLNLRLKSFYEVNSWSQSYKTIFGIIYSLLYWDQISVVDLNHHRISLPFFRGSCHSKCHQYKEVIMPATMIKEKTAMEQRVFKLSYNIQSAYER